MQKFMKLLLNFDEVAGPEAPKEVLGVEVDAEVAGRRHEDDNEEKVDEDAPRGHGGDHVLEHEEDPGLKDERIAERPYHSNFSDQNSVEILSEFSKSDQNSSEISEV